MKKIIKSTVLSLIIFSVTIFIFWLFEPKPQSLLICLLASSVICSLIVFHITNSAVIACTSLIINNFFLIFILIPLSSGLPYYHDNLRFVLSFKNNHGIISRLGIFTGLSLLIGSLTTKIYQFISRCRDREVFVSDRTLKREFLERF